MQPTASWHARFAWTAFGLALILYPALLWRYIDANAPVFDEGEHIAAGYRYWQCADYGINPEHPPLAKLIAAAPVHNWKVDGPEGPCGAALTSNSELIGAGYRLINGRYTDQMLRECRGALVVFPMLLIVTLFFAARAWFGPLAAGIAVLLAVFEPNLTAHGPLVTTDMALTATTLLTLYTTWCYVRKPSPLRLAALGVAMGLALASKHSAVLVPFVVLAAFFVAEPTRRAWRLLPGWLAACLLAMLVLWSTYQFRFEALPGVRGPAFDMTKAIQAAGVAGSPTGRLIAFAAERRLVPESYLAGLLWVKANSARGTYFFGKQLPTGVWCYFPVAISIKTPLPLLLLAFVGLLSPGVWRQHRRSMVFVILPIAAFLGAAIFSAMNLGIRHVLPIYPFLILVASAGASYWVARYRTAAVACAALIAFQAVSYARSFPNEIAYANEAWSGPRNLHRFLGDSNVDWGQSLYLVRDYLQQRGIHDCWIAWFGMRKPQLVGIPCRAMAGPMFLEAWDWELPPPLPDHFDGPILVSSTLTNLGLFGYGRFLDRQPDDVIGAGVYVFHGSFDLPEIAAERRGARGWWFMNHQQPKKAVEEFRIAVEHTHPHSIVRDLYGWALQSSGP